MLVIICYGNEKGVVIEEVVDEEEEEEEKIRIEGKKVLLCYSERYLLGIHK